MKQKNKGRKKKKYNRIDRIDRINKDRIIRDIRTLFDTKKEKEGGKKKKQNQKVIKGNINRNIRTASEQEEKEESFISLKE